MRILNTLQHALTTEQEAELVALGCTKVVHLKEVNPELFASLANTPGEEKAVNEIAYQLVDFIINEFWVAGVILPLGSPAVMFQFARLQGIGRKSQPAFLFAHTERVSEDQPQLDGSIKKVGSFRHVRFLKF